VRADEPSPGQLARAAEVLGRSTRPVLLAGHGAARDDAGAALVRLVERWQVPVATTFHGKGVSPTTTRSPSARSASCATTT